MRIQVVGFLSSFVMLLSTSLVATNAGLDAYQRGDYPAAEKLLRPYAEQGNAAAQVALGSMYEHGRGVATDAAQAANWYRKAAEQADAAGEAKLAYMYVNGRGVPRDYGQAFEWALKAAQKGNPEGQRLLGGLYDRGQGVAKNDAKAFEWYRKAAEQSDAIAQRLHAAMIKNGRGVPKDDVQAFAWYGKAAEQGDSWAQVSLGEMYESGRGVAINHHEAVAWYRKAAEQGNWLGQYRLGSVHEQGQGVTKDSAQAIAWYQKSADQGYAPAKNRLASLSGVSQIPDTSPAVAGIPKMGTGRGVEPGPPIPPRLVSATLGPSHALIVANQDYHDPKIKSLRTPHNDADAVKAALASYGFPAANIYVLKNATRVQLTAQLARLRQHLTDRDNLIIYYAGHGVIDTETDRGYWQMVDADFAVEANWISNDDITNYLKGMKARSVLVVADSCYSGILLRDSAATTRAGGDDVWLRRMAERRSRTALTSGGNEPVLDGGGGANSVFAKAFVDVLKDNKRPQTVTDLFQQVARKVTLDARQTPAYGDIKLAGHEGGDFVLIPSPR